MCIFNIALKCIVMLFIYLIRTYMHSTYVSVVVKNAGSVNPLIPRTRWFFFKFVPDMVRIVVHR